MNSSVQTFTSSGKFLITAEYLILKGAKGLALPLKFGQTLTVVENQNDIINWKSISEGETWFEATLDPKDFQIISTNNDDVATNLKNIFTEARKLNYAFQLHGGDFEISADFNLAWGLGSSSTLINNLALYAKIDPYILLEKTFGGSGYDIACASASGPITYQITEGGRIIERVDFNPPFSTHIFFVYLGKKMNSRAGMSHFNSKAIYSNSDIEEINSITSQIIHCKTLEEFEHWLVKHELLLSSILQIPTIKESRFADYPCTIKSMGAWGGDFVLVTGDSEKQVKDYFNLKGLDTVFSFYDIARI